jgi:tRNA(Arg) A34 adenosine deaminase TadA
MEHEKYMKDALELARRAMLEGEVPVGCVIANADGEIVGHGRNRRERERNALAHAELEAIGEACRRMGDWRLSGCTMYVTLEPCPMCAGAIINARQNPEAVLRGEGRGHGRVRERAQPVHGTVRALPAGCRRPFGGRMRRPDE